MRLVAPAPLIPQWPADAGKQEQDTGDRPHAKRSRRRVADQRLVRPVVGIGDCLAGPLGHARPRDPKEEGAELPALLGIDQRSFGNGVLDAQFLKRRIGAEQRRIVGASHAHCSGAHIGHGDRIQLRVITNSAQIALQPLLEGRLPFPVERSEVLGATFARPDVEHRGGFAVEPVGAPVGRDIAATAPDGSELRAAQRLPHLATVFDIGPGVARRAACRDHPVGHGRGLDVDFAADQTHHCEG